MDATKIETECPLSGVKRTCATQVQMSAFDPKRTFPSRDRCLLTGLNKQTGENKKKEKRLSKQWKEAVADAFSPLAIERRRAAAGLR